jgi:cadmium resistance protein CadD (predicted permease)
MDQETLNAILGQARGLLTALGAGLVTKGVLTVDQETQIITGVLGLLSFAIGMAWSWYAHKYAGPKRIATASAEAAKAAVAGMPAAQAAAQGASISGASDSTIDAARKATTTTVTP